MADYTVKLQRSHNIEGFLSTQGIGTDARNAMLSIPGVEDPKIINETEQLIEIAYWWTGTERFEQTDEYLNRFGIGRVWPCESSS